MRKENLLVSDYPVRYSLFPCPSYFAADSPSFSQLESTLDRAPPLYIHSFSSSSLAAFPSSSPHSSLSTAHTDDHGGQSSDDESDGRSSVSAEVFERRRKRAKGKKSSGSGGRLKVCFLSSDAKYRF
jgi:hypothetical protein